MVLRMEQRPSFKQKGKQVGNEEKQLETIGEPLWGELGSLLNPRIGIQSHALKSDHESKSHDLGGDINDHR